MENKKNKIPELKEIDANSIIKNSNVNLDKSIKAKLKEIANITEINNSNKDGIKELLITCDVLINECHESQTFKTNKNSSIIKLIYEYARLSLKYETYILREQLALMKENYAVLSTEQEELKESTSNITYNILGFIASFSVVSAAVSMFDKITSLTNALLFMAFISWTLLTTLIALNNFYKVNRYNRSILQNNYFLWKTTAFVLVCLFTSKGVEWVNKNKELISQNIGQGIYEAYKNDLDIEKYINEYEQAPSGE